MLLLLQFVQLRSKTKDDDVFRSKESAYEVSLVTLFAVRSALATLNGGVSYYYL
jgi:hypothetical protein